MGREDGKLGQLLHLLPEEDWERFRHYLDSPWFNRSKPTRGLLECYWEARKAGTQLPGDAELHARLLPGQPFDPVKMKNMRAALQRKLDGFLAQRALDGDALLQERLLLRSLNALGETHYFPRYHQKAVSQAEGQPLDEDQRQLALYHLAKLQEEAVLKQSDRSQADLYSDATYHRAWLFFQVQTLKHLVRQANAGAIVGQRADTRLAEAILPLIDDSHLPVVRLYLQLLRVFQEPGERGHFDLLRTHLQAHVQLVSQGEALDLYTGAINYCIRRVNQGETEFLEAMLALYKEMDGRGLLLVDGRLSAAQFKNMVVLALRCQDHDWAHVLIEKYGQLLDHDPHGNAAAFNQGMLHYSKGEFEAAERCFHKVLGQFEDVFYGLDARSFLLRVYYETGNVLGMESLAESFKMYVKRNKRIAKAHLDSYLTTARFFRKLIQIQPWDRVALVKLQEEVAGAAFASSSKQWLLGKVGELLSRE